MRASPNSELVSEVGLRSETIAKSKKEMSNFCLRFKRNAVECASHGLSPKRSPVL